MPVPPICTVISITPPRAVLAKGNPASRTTPIMGGVARLDLEHEASDSVLRRASRELLEQTRADPDALEIVCHGECHLGAGGGAKPVVAAESNHATARRPRELGDQSPSPLPIRVEILLDQLTPRPYRSMEARRHARRRERGQEQRQVAAIGVTRGP